MADIVGAGVNPVGLSNAIGTQINPATYEKQVEMVTYLEEVAGADYDTILATYPSNTVEVYTYTKSGVTTQTITVTYTTSAKTILSSVVKT